MEATAVLGARGALPALRRRWELIAHLAKREVSARHRWTLLGWTWPLARQLAQLAVLVFVFSAVLDLGIEDYPLFVFSGLVAWSWFSAGVTDASYALLHYRHLVFHGRFPGDVLPLVAISVPFVDVLLALPVLTGMLAIEGELHATALLLPALMTIQVVLMAGAGWIVAATSVYFRDVPNAVSVALLMLFYFTPVFYDISRVPEDYQWVLRLNPVGALIESYRDVLMHGRLPDAEQILPVAGVALAVAALGWAYFRRLEPDFPDEL